MSRIPIFGGCLYNNQGFKALMNKNYHDVAAMRASIAKLKASDQIDIETMEYGQYQPILVPLETWPYRGGKAWFREVGYARMQLTAQANATPLSKSEPNVVPLTRCALLDACVRKCFNSEPPIPITIDISQQPMDAACADQHEVQLVWEYGNGDDSPPTRLNLTMICPYTPVTSPSLR